MRASANLARFYTTVKWASRMRSSLALGRSSSGFQIRMSSNAPMTPGELYTRRWSVGLFRSLFVACCHFSAPPVRNTCSQAIRFCKNSSGIFWFPAKWAVLMRILVSACIVAVGCALQPPHAKALSANELVESCNAVEQRAQSAPGDTVDISPEGLPCWYCTRPFRTCPL